MNFRAIAIVVFLVVVSGGLMVHFRQQSITEPKGALANVDSIPVPPKSGPYGKLVLVDDPLFDFGLMEQGQKGSHEFKIRNDGQGFLKLVARKEDHTCQCTLGSLGTEGLKPGEETTVTMNWDIQKPVTNFDHAAKIRTDDPERPVTMFRVRGLVGRRLASKSGNEMQIGMLSDTKQIGMLSDTKLTERVFVVHSEIADAFEITKLAPSTPLIEASSRQLIGEELKTATHDETAEFLEKVKSHPVMKETQAKLKEENSKAQQLKGAGPLAPKHDDAEHPNDDFSSRKPPAKSAYEVKVLFKSGFPIGKFRESLTIHTDIPDTPPMVFVFTGGRAGPVQILSTPGIGWSPEDSLLRLGRFRAQEGKKAKLLFFINKTDNPWEITEAKLSPSFMKFQLIKDEKFKGTGRDRYDFLLEIPAGEAPLSLGGDSLGSIILNTTHPEAKLIRIEVDFTSF